MPAMNKTNFVKDLEAGQSFIDVFLLDGIQEKKTKTGKPYWVLTLRDKTGSTEAKLWSDKKGTPLEIPDPGDFIKVQVDVSTYRDDLDVKITKLRRLKDGEEWIAIEDFVPVGPNDRFAQMEKLRALIEQHVSSAGLRTLLLKGVFGNDELHINLREAPAAKSVHHAYVGGLVDHALSLAQLSIAVAANYENSERPLDLGLLIAASVLHDIGKTKELEWHRSIGYTRSGSLLGHIAIGLLILDKISKYYWEGFTPENGFEGFSETFGFEHAMARYEHLQHIIASHHGQLEWHAIQTPVSLEASVFHLLDGIDAKQEMFRRIESEDKFDSKGFGTSYNRQIEGYVWRQPK